MNRDYLDDPELHPRIKLELLDKESIRAIRELLIASSPDGQRKSDLLEVEAKAEVQRNILKGAKDGSSR